MTRQARRRTPAAALVAIGAAAALAACSGAATPAAPAAPATTATAAAGGQNATVCANLLKIDLTPTPDSDGNQAPAPDAVKSFASTIGPFVDAAAGAAPAEIATPLNQLKAIVATAKSAGTLPAFEDPSFSGAIGAYEKWANTNCGFQSVQLTGTDTALQGAPATLKAGTASILLTNKSAANEFEVVLLVRPKDQSVTQEALVATPPDQFEQAVDIAPSAAAANPGQTKRHAGRPEAGHVLPARPERVEHAALREGRDREGHGLLTVPVMRALPSTRSPASSGR